MLEESLDHTQAFQQAIATTVACRTLIKYNSNLNSEQKEEILSEIETTLAFLSKRLEVTTSSEASTALLAEKPTTDVEVKGEENKAQMEPDQPATPQEERAISLHHLHRLYRAYFSNEHGRGIVELDTRYKKVMVALDQLQELAELRHDVTASDLTVDGLLSRVRGFVTAQYCMFREFASLFTKIVEGQSIDIDTEAMTLLQDYPREPAPQFTRDITPLIRVYNKQRQFQQRKGSLRENARNTTAFLIFLQECQEQTFARRQEVVTQIKNTASLLNELITLLTDYELVIAHIIQSPSASR